MDEQPPEKHSEEKFRLIDEEPKVKKDWEISDLYSRSWEIVKKNKVTWIFGAAVASLATSSSSNFNSNNSFDSEDFQKLFNNIPKDGKEGEKLSQVLGDSITPLQQLLTNVYQTIPMHYYIILGLEIVFLIIGGILIRYIYAAWAHASLIESVYIADQEKTPNVAESAAKGFTNTKSFVLLELIPTLFYVVTIPISILIFVMAFSFGNTMVKIFFGILAAIEVGLIIYWGIIMGIGQIWSYREVAISGKGTKQAFWDGIKIARKKTGSSLILGGVNTFISAIVGMIPLLVLIGIVIAGFVSYFNSQTIPVFLIGAGLLAFIILLPIIAVINGFMFAFKASVWNIAYNQIKGKYTNDK